jgi:hypothetical protein
VRLLAGLRHEPVHDDDDVDGVTYVKFFAPALPRADDLRREGAPWVYNEES